MALVIVLSVFNGFHDLVASLFTNFDPQIEVVPAKGKTVNADAPELDKIRHLNFVDVATDVVEDQAIAVYGDRQRMVTVMGVDENFDQLTRIGDILYGDGDFTLRVAKPLLSACRAYVWRRTWGSALAGQTILRFTRPCVRDSSPTSIRRQTASWSTRCFRRALCSR